MRLRCQCVLILSPGPNGDAPHQGSLFGVDFNHFKSQSVKYWCTKTRGGFNLSQARTSSPPTFFGAAMCQGWARDGPMSTGGHHKGHKGGQWVSLTAETVQTETTEGQIATVVNKRVALRQGKRSCRRAVTKHRAGTTLRLARQCALPVGASTVSTVAR